MMTLKVISSFTWYRIYGKYAELKHLNICVSIRSAIRYYITYYIYMTVILLNIKLDIIDGCSRYF